MSSLNLKCTLGLFFIFIAIHNVTSLKCWNCRSNNDPKCAEPFDNTTIPITDCTQERGLLSMCRKIRQKVNGEWQYIRDCAPLIDIGIPADEKTCLMRTGPDNVLAEYCMCNSKDGCNSSSLLSPMPLLGLFSLLSLMFKMS